MQIDTLILFLPSYNLEEGGSSDRSARDIDLMGSGLYVLRWAGQFLEGLGAKIVSSKMSGRIKAESKLYFKKPKDRARKGRLMGNHADLRGWVAISPYVHSSVFF